MASQWVIQRPSTCQQTGKIHIFPLKFLKEKKKPYIIGPILKNLLVLVKDGEGNIDVVYRECMLFIMYKSEY